MPNRPTLRHLAAAAHDAERQPLIDAAHTRAAALVDTLATMTGIPASEWRTDTVEQGGEIRPVATCDDLAFTDVAPRNIYRLSLFNFGLDTPADPEPAQDQPAAVSLLQRCAHNKELLRSEPITSLAALHTMLQDFDPVVFCDCDDDAEEPATDDLVTVFVETFAKLAHRWRTASALACGAYPAA